MAKVNGVLGEFDTSELGFTLMHEHILVCSWAMRQAFPKWIDRDWLVEHAVAELISVKERGVRSLVDLTPINLGRDIHLIHEVADKAGVQIIAATGFYWTEEPWMIGWDADQLVEFLLKDVEHGIQGTDIRPGVIKCATDEPGVTMHNYKLLQATARLHRATNLPISTHTHVHSRTGLKQQDVFEEEGVDLKRVVIGHCGDTEDIELLEEILRRGSLMH